MRLVLTGLKKMELMPSPKPLPATDYTVLEVQYCGVCRTDAKMWQQGHRDLVFPRVLGHEIMALDTSGKAYTLWPGTACGHCQYCLSGQENLCDSMRIMGFHFDGGYSRYLAAPTASLIPLEAALAPHLACFAEPVGCVLNAFEKIGLQAGDRIVIYGGGTVGLIAALVAHHKKAHPLVIEKNATKIAHAEIFLKTQNINCRRETTDSEFDAALNACADHAAISQAMVKLAKAGRLAFFSGLTKNNNLSTNLLNLLHYKEQRVHGAYGLTRRHMIAALKLIRANQPGFDTLVEGIISPSHLEKTLPRVVAGETLKYILTFDEHENASRAGVGPAIDERPDRSVADIALDTASVEQGDAWRRTVDMIEPVEKSLLPAAQQKIDNKTKPLGALGRLEQLALQMCLIQKRLDPRAEAKALFVFAADHGITEEGVSAFPAEVTAQMVTNFLNGGAAINVLCGHHDIAMRIVDMGVAAALPDHPDLVAAKIRRGTRNFALEPAMHRNEAVRAIEAGMQVFLDAHAETPLDIIGLGEMGIGNTTSATAIISAATAVAPVDATGRGTGIDDAGLRHKTAIIEKALALHRPSPTDGLEVLCKLGGFEIAGIVGAALAAASQRVAVVLDGVISTAAGLIAYLIEPSIAGYLISGHRSVEVAQLAALEHLQLQPVIDLDMRLGEGTGAALAMDTVAAACRIMCEMASFEEAGVSQNPS